jgi:hypothetical protein
LEFWMSQDSDVRRDTSMKPTFHFRDSCILPESLIFAHFPQNSHTYSVHAARLENLSWPKWPDFTLMIILVDLFSLITHF